MTHTKRIDWTAPRKRIWTKKLGDGTAEDVRTMYRLEGKREGGQWFEEVGYALYEDDARLWSTASDLLEACEALVAQFATAVRGPADADVLREAQAAIRKAKDE